jgi:hypothetical protein
MRTGTGCCYVLAFQEAKVVHETPNSKKKNTKPVEVLW